MESTQSAPDPIADLFDIVATPMALLDAGGRVVRINPAWRSLRPGADLSGEPPELSACLDVIDEVPGAASPPGALVRLSADSPTAFRLELQPMGDGQLAVLVDVSSELRALDELKHQHRMRDKLLADAQIGLWWYDPDAEEYILSDELKGQDERVGGRVPLATLRALQHPEDVRREDEIRERLTREPGTAMGEVRYALEDGRWLHLVVHYRSGRKTASGRYRMLGLSQSVTSVAEARDRASTLAKRLHMALQAAKAGVYEYDYATKSAWLSPELEAMLSPEILEDVRARPLAMFRREDFVGVNLAPVPDASGHVPPLECRLRHVDGERWAKLYYDVERDAKGVPTRGVGLVIDIEEQKQRALALDEARRAAEAATQAKSQFLASVSHDIRTPMNGIIGVLNLLGRERLSDRGRQLTREAIACGEMLTRLINDILDLSKIEAAKMELAPEPTNVEEVLDGVIELLAPQAEAKGLYLRKRTLEGVGHRTVDPVRLRQCLFNLIGNAVKFTETGGVEVRLSAPDRGGRPQVARRDRRYGNWRAPGRPSPVVQHVPAGRSRDDQAVRRHGARARDLPPAGQADGRRRRFPQPRGPGLGVLDRSRSPTRGARGRGWRRIRRCPAFRPSSPYRR